MKTRKRVLILLGQILFLPLAFAWAEGSDFTQSPNGNFIPAQSLESAEQENDLTAAQEPVLQEPLFSDVSSLSDVDPITQSINETLVSDPLLSELVKQLDEAQKEFFYAKAYRYLAEGVSAASEGSNPGLQKRMYQWLQSMTPAVKEIVAEPLVVDALARHVARGAMRNLNETMRGQLAQAVREASDASYREHLLTWNEAQKKSESIHPKSETASKSLSIFLGPTAEEKDLKILIHQLSAVLSMAEPSQTVHPWLQWMGRAQQSRLMADYQALRLEILQTMEKPQPSLLKDRLSNDPQEKVLKLRTLLGKILQWRSEVLKGQDAQTGLDLQHWAFPKL